MCVRERLLTGILKVQIHESENIYDRQTQLDKAAVEMRRRRGGFNFQRRRLPTFFCKDDDIVPTSIIPTPAMDLWSTTFLLLRSSFYPGNI